MEWLVVHHYMYKRQKKCRSDELSEAGMHRKGLEDESYLEANKDVSRVCWIEGSSDNSSSNVHQRMQDGGKMW